MLWNDTRVVQEDGAYHPCWLYYYPSHYKFNDSLRYSFVICVFIDNTQIRRSGVRAHFQGFSPGEGVWGRRGGRPWWRRWADVGQTLGTRHSDFIPGVRGEGPDRRHRPKAFTITQLFVSIDTTHITNCLTIVVTIYNDNLHSLNPWKTQKPTSYKICDSHIP